ncbi:MAG: hypothetical protein ACTS6A_02545 [Candidatus Hodgkinia cicadicola]
MLKIYFNKIKKDKFMLNGDFRKLETKELVVRCGRGEKDKLT